MLSDFGKSSTSRLTFPFEIHVHVGLCILENIGRTTSLENKTSPQIKEAGDEINLEELME